MQHTKHLRNATIQWEALTFDSSCIDLINAC